jgi:hypothetical protein
LPAILVARPSPPSLLARAGRVSAGAISERTRSRLQAVTPSLAQTQTPSTANAGRGEAPATTLVPSILDLETIQMERFVVAAEKDPRMAPLPEPESLLVGILKTGRFYTSRTGRTTGDVHFVEVERPWSMQQGDNFIRVEIKFNLRF